MPDQNESPTPGYLNPRTVSYTLSSKMYEYIMRLLDLGVLEGPLGEMNASPEAAKILEALHVVASGGEVSFSVTKPGQEAVIADLNRRLSVAQEEANQINKAAGYYVTAAP